jgi:hypothetical protein
MVYVGVWHTQLNIVAQLSDGSAPTYTDTSLTNTGALSLGVYTLTYNAASAAQTLTLTFTQNLSGAGNVSLQAAAISGGAPTPDFTLSGSPSSQSVVVGQSVPFTATVSALNGFSASVGLSVSGLPAGVSAAFSPTSIPGSGSTTMTLTAANSTVAGVYPLTISGTSGALTHTANVSLTVTDFSIAATPASQTIVAGQSAPYTATVTALSGFTGPVGVTVTGLPTGVTAAFSPASITGSGSSTMTLTAATNTAAGVYPLTVTGTSSGLTRTANVSLTITDFSLLATPGSQTIVLGQSAPYTATVTPLNGFAGAVGLTVTGLPPGVTAAFSPTSITGSGSSSMTLVANAAVPGTYPLTVNGTSGNLTHTAGVSLTVAAAPDFSFVVAPSNQTVAAGLSAPYTATVTALNGFTGTASITVSGLPSGVTAGFSPASVTGSGSSTMTLTVAGTTIPGTYTLTVSGNSGNITHTAGVSLTVTASPDFSISATPASQTVVAGQTAPYTATLTALNGFAGTVGFTVSGLPSGVTAAFSPANLTGSGSSTMTLTVAPATVAGTYPLTISGISGVLSHAANVSLTITQAAAGLLTGSVTKPTGTIQLSQEGSME